jgi:radical SAM superfamily enzyme YgiQ (UPF0313 family)
MNKPKILLINPPFFLEERYGKDLKHFGGLMEPTGLAYLAANLESNNYSVKILDCPALNIGLKEIIQEVKNNDYALIGLTMLTTMYTKVKQTAQAIKEVSPQTKIIVGGSHVTALPKETLEEIKYIDFACIGEGEYTIVELVQVLEGKRRVDDVAGLVHRRNNKVVLNRPRELEKDLDKFPPPARHLLPVKKYKSTATRVQKSSYCATLIVARGCPFNCSYCSHPFGMTFRRHSVERVIQEIESIMKEHNIFEFNMEADNLTVDRNFVISLCQAIIKKGLHKKIRWTCESRMDLIDKKMLENMHKAGCWQISYGVESGVQRLLDLINKKEKLEDMEKAFALTKKVGITIRGFFMLGLPTETREESLQTIKFAKKLDPLWAQFTITTPYPGTPMFNMLKKAGEIRTFNWDHYNTWGGWTEKEISYVPKGRTLKELKSLQKKAVASFYLRPRVFFKFLKTINSWSTLKKYLLGFITLLKIKLEKRSK